MRIAPFCLGLLCLPVLGGCPRSAPKPDPAPAASPSPVVTASVGAATSFASAPAELPPPPICRVESKKVWASGANTLTGLTEAELSDDRVALGLALGLQPAVLVVSKGGAGKLYKLALKPGTQIATPPKRDEGTRQLLRVTPVKVDGDQVRAFVDFRDELKNKRRRIACGPAESDEWWVAFNDVPFFSRDDRSESVVKTLFTEGSGGASTYHEIQDCRTFADLSRGETWILGSGLHGSRSADGTLSWRSTLFVDLGAKSHESHLHVVELKGDPPKQMPYEIPVSQRLEDGSFLVAVRNSSRLLVGLLNPDKTPRGDFVPYLGFPTLPDIAQDGDDVVLSTSLAQGKGEFSLRALRISSSHPKLPKNYTVVQTDETVSGSETEPDFTRDMRGQRWMAHIEGERGKGRLSIAPIDADFRLQGQPYTVTEEGEHASEPRLVAMRDGGILTAFLRERDGAVELVTEDLHCERSR